MTTHWHSIVSQLLATCALVFLIISLESHHWATHPVRNVEKRNSVGMKTAERLDAKQVSRGLFAQEESFLNKVRIMFYNIADREGITPLERMCECRNKQKMHIPTPFDVQSWNRNITRVSDDPVSISNDARKAAFTKPTSYSDYECSVSTDSMSCKKLPLPPDVYSIPTLESDTLEAACSCDDSNCNCICEDLWDFCSKRAAAAGLQITALVMCCLAILSDLLEEHPTAGGKKLAIASIVFNILAGLFAMCATAVFISWYRTENKGLKNHESHMENIGRPVLASEKHIEWELGYAASLAILGWLSNYIAGIFAIFNLKRVR